MTVSFANHFASIVGQLSPCCLSICDDFICWCYQCSCLVGTNKEDLFRYWTFFKFLQILLRFCHQLTESELEKQRQYSVTVHATPCCDLNNLYKQYGDHFHREWPQKDWDSQVVSAYHHLCHQHPRVPRWMKNAYCCLFASSLEFGHNTCLHPPVTIYLFPILKHFLHLRMGDHSLQDI